MSDFNIPKVETGDVVYNALRKRGLRRPAHSTRIYSNIAGDKNYDQIMFFPRNIRDRYSGKMGIFDFDGALFPDLWRDKTKAQFRAYLRYFISDHRLLWAEFNL